MFLSDYEISLARDLQISPDGLSSLSSVVHWIPAGHRVFHRLRHRFLPLKHLGIVVDVGWRGQLLLHLLWNWLFLPPSWFRHLLQRPLPPRRYSLDQHRHRWRDTKTTQPRTCQYGHLYMHHCGHRGHAIQEEQGKTRCTRGVYCV